MKVSSCGAMYRLYMVSHMRAAARCMHVCAASVAGKCLNRMQLQKVRGALLIEDGTGASGSSQPSRSLIYTHSTTCGVRIPII